MIFHPKTSDPPKLHIRAPTPNFFKTKNRKRVLRTIYEIRFKSLSVSLEIFTKFGQKFVHFCHFEPFFGQIEANVHYLQATSEKTD